MILITKSDLGAPRWVALPIHDAVAVELDHMSWTCDAMRVCWEEEMKEIHKGARAVVSTKITD